MGGRRYVVDESDKRRPLLGVNGSDRLHGGQESRSCLEIKKVINTVTAWLGFVALLDVVLVIALAGHHVIWRSFDFTVTFFDIVWLVFFRATVSILLSGFICLRPKTSLPSSLWLIVLWINFMIIVYGVSKVLALDYHQVNLLGLRIVVVEWIVLGILQRILLFRIKNSHEDYLWKQSIVVDTLESQAESGVRNDVPGSSPIKPDAKDLTSSNPKLFYRGLFKVLKPYFLPKKTSHKLRCCMTWVFLIISKVANLISPLYLGSATQELADKNLSNTKLYEDIAIFAALTLVSKVAKELQNVVYLSVKQVAYVEIAETTFSHLHSLSLEWHLKKKMGNMLRSMDRGVLAANTIVTYLFLNIGPTIVECLVVLGVFYSHFKIPTLSAAAFFCFVMYAKITVDITTWRKKFRTLTNKHDNDYHDKATDSLINYETVKYFTAEQYETDRYIDSVSKFQTYFTSTAYSLSFLNSMQSCIMQFCIGICLCIIAYEIRVGRQEVGTFVSVMAYIDNLFTPLNFLGSFYNAIIQALLDMTNLIELLKEEPDLVDSPDATELTISKQDHGASIEFRGVSFCYPSANGRFALNNVYFRISQGDTLAICGSTGSGKSTIARLLFRFYDPSNGSILIANQDIKYATQMSLRRTIGVVPQDTVLFNDTLLHNIKYGYQNATQADIERACESAQILDFIRTLPDGFNTIVGERGLRLSGGEKQRVSIARCILKDPSIVILDEATSALDSVTERSIQVALNGLASQRTSVIIAHRLTTIQDADKIIVLEQGCVVESGTHSELLSLGQAYSTLWNARLEEQQAMQSSKP